MSLLRPSSSGPSLEDLVAQLTILTGLHYEEGKSRVDGMSLYSLATRVPKAFISEIYKSIGSLFIKAALDQRSLLKQVYQLDSLELLQAYGRLWEQYKRMVKRTSIVCMYLDRLCEVEALKTETFLIEIEGKKFDLTFLPINDLGFFVWASIVLLHVKERDEDILRSKFLSHVYSLRAELTQSISSESIGSGVSFQLGSRFKSLEQFVDSYICADMIASDILNQRLYSNDIEAQFIAATSQFYPPFIVKILETTKFPKYLEHANKIIAFETECYSNIFLDLGQKGYDTTLALRKTICETLVTKQIALFYGSLPELLSSGDLSTLKIFLQLLVMAEDATECNLLGPAVKIFEEENLNSFQLKVESFKRSNDPDSIKIGVFFVELNKFLANLLNLQAELFDNRKNFEESIKRIKETVANSKIGKSSLAFYLAKFTDMTLSESPSIQAGEDLSRLLGQLVPHLGASDEFSDVYKKHLCSRLLYLSNPNLNLELECLKGFPSELEMALKRMIADVEKDGEHDENFHCNVLTSFSWPIPSELAPFPEKNLPKEFKNFVYTFSAAFLRESKNKKLDWVHQMSRVTLDYTMGVNGKTFELALSFCQAMLLLRLQEVPSLAFIELPDLLKISRKDCYRQLRPLVAVGLIKYDGVVKGYSDMTEFLRVSLNAAFDSGKSRLKFAPVSLGGGGREDASGLASPMPEPMEVGDQGLSEQDKYILQCSIVRILKRNKSASSAHLCQLVLQDWNQQQQQRRSQLTIPDIGGCLELLQEKGFIEYDEVRALYIYLP